MASPLIYPKFQGIAPTTIGAAAAGFKLKTFAAGTSTPLVTYTDSTLTVPNATTVVLDANGEANVWLGNAAYKFIFTDAADVVIWTVDNVTQANLGGAIAEWLPTKGVVTFISATSFSCPVDIITGTNTSPAVSAQCGTRIQFQTGSGTGYATILALTSTSPYTYTIKVTSGVAFDNTLTSISYGIVALTPPSVYQNSLAIAQAGGNVNLVNATPTKLGGAPSEIVDRLDELATDTFTAKVAGTYRVWGTVLFNEGAATTGIVNVNQSVVIRKNGAANITETITWIVANSTASTQAIPFNGSLTLAVGDTVDIAVTGNFTGTAPSASLASLNIERVL